MNVFLWGGGAWLIVTVVVIVGFVYKHRQPSTDADGYCARVDVELDVADRAGRSVRATVAADGGVVVDFPRRLRVIRGGLAEAGAVADGVWRERVVVPVDGGPQGEFLPGPGRAA